MENDLKSSMRLQEIWQRLEIVGRRLWDEDSPAAVDLQALLEEYKGEVHRVEQQLVSYKKLHHELRQTVSKEVAGDYMEQIRELQMRQDHDQGRVAALEASSAKKDAKIQELLGELASKEAINLEFHDKFLKAASDHDESRAKKMEGFYQELLKKETLNEAHWEERHVTLESEHKLRTEMLKKKHEELLEDVKRRALALDEHYSKRERELELAMEQYRRDKEAWETQRLSEQDSIAKRREELSLQSQTLANEYHKKQAELQKLKESLQTELTEVVRQYQAKMRGAGS